MTHLLKSDKKSFCEHSLSVVYRPTHQGDSDEYTRPIVTVITHVHDKCSPEVHDNLSLSTTNPSSLPLKKGKHFQYLQEYLIYCSTWIQ